MNIIAGIMITLISGALLAIAILYTMFDIFYKEYERNGKYKRLFHDIGHMHVPIEVYCRNKHGETMSKCKYCDVAMIYDSREGWRVANENER